MNKGTLVYSDAVNVGDVADDLKGNCVSDSECEDDDVTHDSNTDTNMAVHSAI